MAGENYLIKRISDGLVGWMLFQRAAGRRRLNLEHFLYPPVFEIGIGQGWKTLPQYPLVSGKLGAPQTLDFLFRRNSGNGKSRKVGLAAVELKLIRKSGVNELMQTVTKLRKVKAADLQLDQDYGPLSRYVMLCGDSEYIQNYLASRRTHVRQFRALMDSARIDAILDGKKSNFGFFRLAHTEHHSKPMALVFKIESSIPPYHREKLWKRLAPAR